MKLNEILLRLQLYTPVFRPHFPDVTRCWHFHVFPRCISRARKPRRGAFRPNCSVKARAPSAPRRDLPARRTKGYKAFANDMIRELFASRRSLHSTPTYTNARAYVGRIESCCLDKNFAFLFVAWHCIFMSNRIDFY